MTPSPKANPITRTVFDLTAFADIQLTKDFTNPPKPETLEAAVAVVGNDTSKLLDLIHRGLIAEARDAAYQDISGFMVIPDEGDPVTPYNGKFAAVEVNDKGEVTRDVPKLINNAILTLAKLQGYDKSLPKEKKDALKESATNFLRANPAMLSGLMPSAPAESTPATA